MARHTRIRLFLMLLLLAAGQGAAVSRARAQTLTILASPTTPLSVTTVTAGSQPDPSLEDATTSYTAVVLALSTMKIVARLESALPAGVTLKVRLQATLGSSSPGNVDLDVSDRTVLSNMTGGTLGETYSGSIAYTLTSTVAAAPFTNSVAVIFSLVNQ